MNNWCFQVYEDGILTPKLDVLEEGSEIEVSYPEGSFNIEEVINVSHLTLLGAGTGITPLIKLLLFSLSYNK